MGDGGWKCGAEGPIAPSPRLCRPHGLSTRAVLALLPTPGLGPGPAVGPPAPGGWARAGVDTISGDHDAMHSALHDASASA